MKERNIKMDQEWLFVWIKAKKRHSYYLHLTEDTTLRTNWGCYGSLALPGAHLEGKTVHKSSSLIGSFIAATIKAMVYELGPYILRLSLGTPTYLFTEAWPGYRSMEAKGWCKESR